MTSLTPGAPDNSWRQGLRSRRLVLMVGSSHKCMHDSGMISPITRRPKDEE